MKKSENILTLRVRNFHFKNLENGGMLKWKISIDTKEDSHEEIKKIIKMLSSLVGEEVLTNQGDTFNDDSSQTRSSGMFNMFNNPESENKTDEEKKEKVETDVDIPKVKDIPEVEEYDD